MLLVQQFEAAGTPAIDGSEAAQVAAVATRRLERLDYWLLNRIRRWRYAPPDHDVILTLSFLLLQLVRLDGGGLVRVVLPEFVVLQDLIRSWLRGWGCRCITVERRISLQMLRSSDCGRSCL